MELFKALSPIIPVFLLVLIGFIFAYWKKISPAAVTEIIVYLQLFVWFLPPSPASLFLPEISSFC
jgi:hypothetical protein